MTTLSAELQPSSVGNARCGIHPADRGDVEVVTHCALLGRDVYYFRIIYLWKVYGPISVRSPLLPSCPRNYGNLLRRAELTTESLRILHQPRVLLPMTPHGPHQTESSIESTIPGIIRVHLLNTSTILWYGTNGEGGPRSHRLLFCPSGTGWLARFPSGCTTSCPERRRSRRRGWRASIVDT